MGIIKIGSKVKWVWFPIQSMHLQWFNSLWFCLLHNNSSHRRYTHTQKNILGSNDHSKAKTWAPEALQGWDDSGFGACWSFLAGQKYTSHCSTGNAFGFGMFMGLWHHCVGPPLYGITLPHDWHLFTELWYGYWYINGGSNYVSLSWKPCRQPVTWHRSAWIGKSARRV